MSGSHLAIDFRFSLKTRVGLTFVANRSIGPDDRLLHLGSLVLGKQCRCRVLVLERLRFVEPLHTSDRETGNIVVLWEFEFEDLSIVVDDLDVIQEQRDESLITPGKSLLWFCDLWNSRSCGGATRRIVPDTSGAGGCDTSVEESIGATAGLGGLGCITAEVLQKHW